MADLKTFNKGEKILISLGIENGDNCWEGPYQIGIRVNDKNLTGYSLRKDSAGNLVFVKETEEASYTQIEETIPAGTSMVKTYTAVVPDCENGKVTGWASIWDGIKEAATTIEGDAYIYEKKKYSMTLSVSWEKAV